MSNTASSKDIKAARKLIQKLRDEVNERSEKYQLSLADEALERVETNYHYISLNKLAQNRVQSRYREAQGREGEVWNYMLRLLEDDLRKRGG